MVIWVIINRCLTRSRLPRVISGPLVTDARPTVSHLETIVMTHRPRNSGSASSQPLIHTSSSSTAMSLGDRYLNLLGLERPAKLDLAALTTILHAHLRAFPFENVTPFSGIPVSVDTEEIYAKFASGRGGYCMEHHQLCQPALADIGFAAERQMARVYVGTNERALAQTHQVTLVTFPDDSTYIFDPGFGATTPKTPLCISSGPEPQKNEWQTLRVVPATHDVVEKIGAAKVGEDVHLIVESEFEGNWMPQYGLTRPGAVHADIEAFNWWVCTYPKSNFVTNLMCATWNGDDDRVTVGGRVVKKRSPGRPDQVAVMDSEEDARKWLVEEMGLRLSEEELRRCWEKLSTLPRPEIK